MKFNDYVKDLNDFLEKHPESGEMKVIYAADDEGNAYQEVYWNGVETVGNFDGKYRGEYIPKEYINEEEGYFPEDYPINSIVIN